MLLRKLNAILSLLATLLLLGHAIPLGFWMLLQGTVPAPGKCVPWALVWVFGAHALVSIVIMISSHLGGEKRKVNAYPKLNLETVLQRLSGALLVLFTWLHVAGAIGLMTPPPLVHAIVPILFFTLCLAHVALSGSKPLITLGLGSTKTVKWVDVHLKALCVVTLAMDMVGFYLHKV